MLTDFKKKKNPLKQIMMVAGSLLIMGAVVFLFIADVNVFKKREKFDSEIMGLEAKIDDMRDKNNQLKEEISNVADERYVEKIAREELSLQKPGEKAVLFVPGEGAKTENQQQVQKGFWANWLAWISNVFKK